MTTETQADVAKARAELAATLAALEDRLNVPKQARLAVTRADRRLRELSDKNPMALVVAVVGVAALVGGAVWLVVRSVRK